jgi:hypothetical protein
MVLLRIQNYLMLAYVRSELPTLVYSKILSRWHQLNLRLALFLVQALKVSVLLLANLPQVPVHPLVV